MPSPYCKIIYQHHKNIPPKYPKFKFEKYIFTIPDYQAITLNERIDSAVVFNI